MYLNYWRLKEEPFNNALDLRFLHMTPQHSEGVARLLYAVQQHKEGAVLTGGFGTGKSLVRKFFLSRLEAVGDFAVALIENPLLEPEVMVRNIYEQITNKPLPADAASGGFQALTAALEERHANHFQNLIVVEEAQLITKIEVLEQLRLLMNLADARGKPLLTLIFVGQDDFLKLFAQSPGLVQRIPARWNITPLTVDQTRDYIDHRLSVAGANGWIFEDSAIDALHAFSEGTARVVNNTADMALYLGMRENAVRVNDRIIERVAADLQSNLPPDRSERPS